MGGYVIQFWPPSSYLTACIYCSLWGTNNQTQSEKTHAFFSTIVTTANNYGSIIMGGYVIQFVICYLLFVVCCLAIKK
jgi:hypothetical protein